MKRILMNKRFARIATSGSGPSPLLLLMHGLMFLIVDPLLRISGRLKGASHLESDEVYQIDLSDGEA